MSHPLQTTQRDEAALDAAIAEYLELADCGNAPGASEFLAKYSSLAPQLRDFLEMSDIVEEIVAEPPPVDHSGGMKETSDSLHGRATLFSREPLTEPCATSPDRGVKFGRYLLREVLGEGSMGKVQLAYDTALDRLVALKMPRFDNRGDSIERFYREARASATLRHPHICPIFDVGAVDNTHFLSMAYIEGQSLAQLMETQKPLPVARALEIIAKLALALEEAHRHNVIHRDLKPANIMLDGSGQPIVTDFGLARRLGAHETLLTQSCMLVGTLSFMSPEQMEGGSNSISRSTDIYSLGVIFYQLLTGVLPFRGSFVSVIVQVRHGRPVPPSLIRPELTQHPGVEAICLKMMAKRPEQRYSSMAELGAAIAALSEPVAAPPLPPELAEPLPPPVAASTIGQIAPAPPFWNVSGGWQMGGVSCVGLLMLSMLLLPKTGYRSRPDITDGNLPPATVAADPPEPSREREPPKAVPVLPPPVQANPDKPGDGLAAIDIPSPEPPPPAEQERVANALPADRQPLIFTSRIAERKFGVAEVSLEFPPGTGPGFRPDHACHLVTDGKAHYPAFAIELEQEAVPDAAEAAGDTLVPTEETVKGRVARFTAYFLYRDQLPIKVRLLYAGQPLTEELTIDGDERPNRRPLLEAWWAAYTAPAREPLNADARQVKTYLDTMLARRLELPAPASIPLPNDDASILERYFEKSVGTFLGFSSVRAAIGTDQDQADQTREPANQPLPRAPQIASVPVPPITGQVPIEAIASHVPDDCVYLRCQSVDNYLWFRQLLLGWGGTLDEVVSSRTRDDRIRDRLEEQLALTPAAEFTGACSDMALIFGDPFFDHGAAVGVLFQASSHVQLDRHLRAQRVAAQKNYGPGASEKLIQLGNYRVSLLSTGDKRLLSYYAVHGDCHLVTNSEYLVTRFFEAGAGQRSLARLPEFRYARTKVRVHDSQSVFLYMSDPFFQRIISPHYQIERSRRCRARRELEELSLAYLAASNEGSRVRSVADLRRLGYLSAQFGVRSDGTTAELQGAAGAMQAEDSRRGLAGYFVPICDMPVTAATRGEVEAYQQFEQQYRTEYRMIDPVALVASHRTGKDGQQMVDLEIAITPYAFGKYEPLRNFLTAPQNREIADHEEDILRLNAAMRTQHGVSFLAYAAVRDAAIDFQLSEGKVHISGASADSTFAENNYYAAFDRRDPDCIWSVVAVTNALGLTHVNIDRAKAGLENWGRFVDGFVALPLRLINPWGSSQPREVERGPGWQVRSSRTDLRAEKLEHVASSDTKQARLELKELQGRKVEPYIQAYTYMEARRASARNAALLELASQQLGLHEVEAIDGMERVFCARIVCPLGGEYLHGKSKSNGAPTWHSDRWTAASLYDEHVVPPEYRFAFLDWLRGLNVGFALENQTLKADLRLQVKPPADAAPVKAASAKAAR